MKRKARIQTGIDDRLVAIYAHIWQPIYHRFPSGFLPCVSYSNILLSRAMSKPPFLHYYRNILIFAQRCDDPLSMWKATLLILPRSNPAIHGLKTRRVFQRTGAGIARCLSQCEIRSPCAVPRSLTALYNLIVKTGPLAAVGANVLFHPARVNPAQIIRACAVEVIGTGRAKAHD